MLETDLTLHVRRCGEDVSYWMDSGDTAAKIVAIERYSALEKIELYVRLTQTLIEVQFHV